MNRSEGYVAETERATIGDPLSQGDIVEIDDGSDAGDYPKRGVLINADCDLRHDKLDGTIAYLPIYSFEDYLKDFWAKAYVSSAAQQALGKVRNLCDLLETEADELVDWLRSDTPDDVASKLISTVELKKGQADQLRVAIQMCAHCQNEDASHFDRFVSLMKMAKSPRDETEKQFLAALNALGEGHLFINEIVGLRELGHVIRMRRIYSMPADRCFPSYSERQARGQVGLTAFRIGRLTPLYKFKVAQSFGHQFSRVGLPDESKALAAVALSELADQVIGALT